PVENVERNALRVDNNSQRIRLGGIALASNRIDLERVLNASNGEIVLKIFGVEGQTVLAVQIIAPARSQITLHADLHPVRRMTQIVDAGSCLDGAAAIKRSDWPGIRLEEPVPSAPHSNARSCAVI